MNPPILPNEPPGQNSAIAVRSLVHTYKTHRAVQGVSFTVSKGSIHGFVGPNGAGKTTTLKAIATLLKPSSGVIYVMGHLLPSATSLVRRMIGYMPDHFSMYRQMSVYEYLDFFGAAYGIATAKRHQTINAVLDLTDMSARQNDFIGGLSRGMQQRVALARVLVHDPEVLLLDEPASGLDPRARIELMDILRELRSMNKTIFISSHILSELAELCDEVTVMDRGQVQYTGTMDGLIRNEDTSIVAYSLRVATPSDALRTALEAIPGVNGVEVASPQEMPETQGQMGAFCRYIVSGDRGQLVANDLLRCAIDQGIPVIEFKENLRHLNEAFLDLTQPGVRT